MLIRLDQLSNKTQGYEISPFPLSQASRNLLLSISLVSFLCNAYGSSSNRPLLIPRIAMTEDIAGQCFLVFSYKIPQIFWHLIFCNKGFDFSCASVNACLPLQHVWTGWILQLMVIL